jgi:hypothetical protein
MSESSGLPPEQDAVRRLLADARHDGPPPPDVVDRLDETLASLVAERSGELTSEHTAGAATGHDDRSPGRVVDLGSRRRRVASIGLLAAASVVVAGVALGQALPRGSNDAADSSAGSASDSSLAESPRSQADDGAGASAEEGGDAGSESDLLEPDAKESFLQPGRADRPTLSSDDEDIVGQLLALRPAVSDGRQRLRSLAALRGCDGVEPGPSAAVLSAQVDGETGLVVFRRPVGAEQGVELYACGNPLPLRTITLPAP